MFQCNKALPEDEKVKYKYLVVIDFEATCSETNENFVHEIIEFPAVLVDVHNQAVVSSAVGLVGFRFHCFILVVCRMCPSRRGVLWEDFLLYKPEELLTLKLWADQSWISSLYCLFMHRAKNMFAKS